jgi:hypothetical protein
MAAAVKRRITIFDVMALVAVTAVSIVGARYMLSLMDLPPGWWGVSALTGSSAAVLTATLALIPLRLCHPRPHGEHLWRQPGWLACIAVALTLGISLAQQLLEVGFILIRLGPSRLDLTSLFRSLMLGLPSKAVFAVAAAWTTLGLVCGWESEKGWIDRLGRLFGLYWIVYPILTWIVEFVAAW